MARTTRTPGADDGAPPTPEAEALGATLTPDEAAAQIAALKAQLAETNARLSGLVAAQAVPAGDAVVFEPETPHGKMRLAESPTRNMTTAEVAELIDAGKMSEPTTSYLCRDGYFTRRV